MSVLFRTIFPRNTLIPHIPRHWIICNNICLGEPRGKHLGRSIEPSRTTKPALAGLPLQIIRIGLIYFDSFGDAWAGFEEDLLTSPITISISSSVTIRVKHFDPAMVPRFLLSIPSGGACHPCRDTDGPQCGNEKYREARAAVVAVRNDGERVVDAGLVHK